MTDQTDPVVIDTAEDSPYSVIEPDPVLPAETPYIAVFNRFTGDIKLSASNQRIDLLEELYVTEDTLFIICNYMADCENEYVCLESLELKQRSPLNLQASKSNILADGLDSVYVEGIPTGTTVEVMGPVYDKWIEDSGSIEVTTDIAGAYAILFDCPTYARAEVWFYAT